MRLLRASSLALLVALTAPAAAQTDADALHIRGRVTVTAILDPEFIVGPLRAEDGRRTEAWVTLSAGSRARVELRFD